MQKSATRDLVVGLFVALGLAALGYLSLQVGGMSWNAPGGLTLYATFDEIGGLKTRAPVVIAGVKVGQVSAIELDHDLRARVTLDVDPNVEIASDSSAAIRTSGVLGDQYVAIEPGAETEPLRSGGTILYTNGAISLEKVIGGFVAGLDEDEHEKEEEER
jgi:phospholipid/cholesterol/gamma-HCH transport system substrate-binding protein